MSYFDGFVIGVPIGKKQEYIDLARKVAAAYIEYGALRVTETWGDDLKRGKHTDFFTAVKASDEEGVVFSFVEWPDKATRDAGNEKIMQDPRMQPEGDIPFNMQTIIFGGFETFSDLKA